MITAVLTPLLMFMFISSLDSIVLSFISLFLLGFFAISAQPIILAFVNELPTNRIYLINGIYMSLYFVINSLNVLGISFISDYISLGETFKHLIWFSALGIPMVFVIKHYKQKF